MKKLSFILLFSFVATLFWSFAPNTGGDRLIGVWEPSKVGLVSKSKKLAPSIMVKLYGSRNPSTLSLKNQRPIKTTLIQIFKKYL